MSSGGICTQPWHVSALARMSTLSSSPWLCITGISAAGSYGTVSTDSDVSHLLLHLVYSVIRDVCAPRGTPGVQAAQKLLVLTFLEVSAAPEASQQDLRLCFDLASSANFCPTCSSRPSLQCYQDWHRAGRVEEVAGSLASLASL